MTTRERLKSAREVQALYLRAAGAREVDRLKIRAQLLPKMMRVLGQRACDIALAPRGVQS